MRTDNCGWLGTLQVRGQRALRGGVLRYPGCRLYVSMGLGTSVLPLRWGAVPEIAEFDL